MKFGLAMLIAMAAGAAELRVAVQDPSGARIAGASVEVRPSSGGSLEARTSAGGEAVFDVPSGKAEVRIAADGFASQTVFPMVRPGGSRIAPKLRIAERRDEVNVSTDPREEATDPRGNGFSTVLTEQQIAALPDDPEEMEKVLKDMAGPGATFRVDGFLGGRLPHKSQIKSIRFRVTPYSADEHDMGFMVVDIQTRPGMGGWRGSLNFGFGDDALNARNAFAPVREPQQTRRFDATLAGPLRAGRTGSSFWFSRSSSYDSRAGAVVLPEGPLGTLIRLPRDSTNANARFDHGIGKTHVLRGVYEFARQERSNVRDFDLPERRSTSLTEQHALRFSDTGNLGNALINEFRTQTTWNNTGMGSISSDPAVIVQGAFNSGGAALDSERRWRDTEFTDHLTFGKGRHAFKAGGQVNLASYTEADRSNAAGTFTFSGLAAWNAGRPQLFTQLQGAGDVSYRQTFIGGYVQDDVRLLKNLSLSLGVRYETQPGVGDRINFAPRGGVAWSPFRGGRTTLRAGGGVFYQWFDSSLYGETLRQDGLHQSTLVVSDPGYPDPLAGGLRAPPPPSVVRQAPSLRLPYTWRASAGVQQQIGSALMLMTDVRVQRGVDLWYGSNVNAPLGGARPDPRNGNIIEIGSGASSFMRGLMVMLSPAPGSAMAKRYFWHAFYQLNQSKNESDSALVPAADSRDRRGDWGPSMADVRHRVGGMLQYTLPHGLQIGTMLRVQSAPPYNITTGIDVNRDTVLNDRPAGVGRNSARAEGQWYLDTRVAWTKSIGTRQEASATPATRTIRIGGDARDIPDFGVGSKPGEPAPILRTQIYAQVFNVFNHANRTGYTGVLTSPLYGLPTAAMAPRRMEVGLKFSF